MKKIFPLISLLIFLFGCSSVDDKKQYTIGFSQNTMGDSWRKTMWEEMQLELHFHEEYALILSDAEGSTEKQIFDIRKFIKEGVDLIIVSPNEKDPFNDVLNEVLAQGIPLIVLDRKAGSDNYTAYVGADNYLVGQNAAIAANILLKGKGKIMEIGEGINTTPTINRHLGFTNQVNTYPGLALHEYIIEDWENETVEEGLKRYLTQNPDTDLVFAHNDRVAEKANIVCREMGLANNVKIIGVDGLAGENEGLDLVEKGIISATILYPTGGEEAIRIADKILKNEPFEKENMLFSTVINSENVRVMKQQANKIREQQLNISSQSAKMTNLVRTFSSQRNILFISVALLCLLIVFGAILLFLLNEKQFSNKVLAEQNASIKRQNDEIERVSLQARKATEEKLRFYSYISHEFKTPLSLILTPTEDLLETIKPNKGQIISTLQLISKNGNRLLRLVNQLLDIRQLDSGKMQLNTQVYDLKSFVQNVFDDFALQAKVRQIEYHFHSQIDKLNYSFDAEKMDKVMFNLLSNAFKYTPEGGRIGVSIIKKSKRIEISVADNGEGMSPEEKEHAFDLFYRGNPKKTLGTGLGLTLSNEFVILHSGEILIDSNKGKGTTFTVVLPIHLQDEEAVVEVSPEFKHSIEEKNKIQHLSKHSQNEISLVIIEDNPDMLQFLVAKFSTFYRVFAAQNAEDGWLLILKEIPDLIISDVMLPGKNGFWLTTTTKEDFRTSHIPVILLTAKGKTESQIEGIQAGADSYVSKPFNQRLLEEKVKSLIGNRERMKKRYSSEVSHVSQVSGAERKFLIELENLIEKNLQDNTLSVENLSVELGMSRVQLYRKVTALTGHNVNDYISEYRLNKARTLLENPDKNISEIAYELGFGNPSYFTTFFKQKTGKTPTEWRS